MDPGKFQDYLWEDITNLKGEIATSKKYPAHQKKILLKLNLIVEVDHSTVNFKIIVLDLTWRRIFNLLPETEIFPWNTE